MKNQVRVLKLFSRLRAKVISGFSFGIVIPSTSISLTPPGNHRTPHSSISPRRLVPPVHFHNPPHDHCKHRVLTQGGRDLVVGQTRIADVIGRYDARRATAIGGRCREMQKLSPLTPCRGRREEGLIRPHLLGISIGGYYIG